MITGSSSLAWSHLRPFTGSRCTPKKPVSCFLSRSSSYVSMYPSWETLLEGDEGAKWCWAECAGAGERRWSVGLEVRRVSSPSSKDAIQASRWFSKMVSGIYGRGYVVRGRVRTSLGEALLSECVLVELFTFCEVGGLILGRLSASCAALPASLDRVEDLFGCGGPDRGAARLGSVEVIVAGSRATASMASSNRHGEKEMMGCCPQRPNKFCGLRMWRGAALPAIDGTPNKAPAPASGAQCVMPDFPRFRPPNLYKSPRLHFSLSYPRLFSKTPSLLLKLCSACQLFYSSIIQYSIDNRGMAQRSSP